MLKGKKGEIGSLRRELDGEREVRLQRLSGDTGTDEGERRLQLIWQNFRIHNCTKADAVVLGTEHPEFCEGRAAAAGNSEELFETELFPAGPSGVPLQRLSTIHSYYFGGGFEKSVGVKLRAFVTQRYEYDEKTGRVKAKAKVLTALRKMEARELVADEREFAKKAKTELYVKNEERALAGQKEMDDQRKKQEMAERAKRVQELADGIRPMYKSTMMTALQDDE